jgi:serine/threonine protein kinase
MLIEDWIKVEELLNAALELEPSERRKFLDELGARAPDLRREVESLLACEEKVDGFLLTPALSFSADFFDDDTALDARAGQEIGNYRIVREIGRGGQGAVFLAERADGEFKQEVALKVVRRSFADSDLARRFRQERQILASLNHTNIARLLDGGVSADGEPYLVMEYVEGVRVDDYCELHRLPTRDRLRLFLEVCRGVAYAHQHLVVHRDIKPSNILVTTDGVPKLLDFGIAKLLDPEHEGEHTRTELRAFTPDYASPEQIGGGQVTTASDVYSLGVLLQNILHGSPNETTRLKAPGGWLSKSFGRTSATNLPTNEAESNQKPKLKDRQFPDTELAYIVAMARREDPARRYPSVAQFAEDVQRYLDGLPVRAQKDSLAYRAEKFVRRNKVAVIAAALVSLSLVVGFAAALWQAKVARRERDRAERRFTDVRQLSNALLTDIAPKIERLQGSTEARQALVIQSLKYLDSLAQESVDDTGLQAELAAAYEKIGDLQGNPAKPNLSHFAGAISSYEKANQIRRNLPNTRENQLLLAENFRSLADVRYVQNDVKGTLEAYAEALKIHENLLLKEPESYDLQTSYLKTKFKLAETYVQNNQFSLAAVMLREIAGALERFDPNQLETRRFLAMVYSQLGNALSWDDKQSEAEIELGKATAIADRLAAENSNDTNIRQSVFRVYLLASSIYENNNDEISLQFAYKALRVAEQAVASDTADVQAKQNLAKAFSRVGFASVLLKRFPEAISNLEKSEQVFLELHKREPASRSYQRDLGNLYTRFGDAKQKQGDLQGALNAFQKSADYFEQAFQTDEKNTLDRRNLAQSLKSVGKVYLELSEKKKAKENFQRALEILNQLKAQNALGEWDEKLFDEVRNALRSL